MKLNTNSNSYIIIYSAILVVIVAFLLAFVYQALKPMQDANVALDVKKQILYSLNTLFTQHPRLGRCRGRSQVCRGSKIRD